MLSAQMFVQKPPLQEQGGLSQIKVTALPHSNTMIDASLHQTEEVRDKEWIRKNKGEGHAS